jgi:peptidoglycan/xylan/chitin deacetylase (PgdA/CDA1 family)
MMQSVKQIFLRGFEFPIVGRLASRFGSARCAVLMLHRFASPTGAARGHSTTALHDTLASLARSGVAFESIDDVVARLRTGAAPSAKRRLSVAITVDDGYADLLDVEHIFAEFDCPVTGFVVPSVINGDVWFWWDQIDWIFRHAATNQVDLAILGETSVLRWQDETTRLVVQDHLGERLKLVPNHVRLECLAQLSLQLDVPFPDRPPDEYRVLTWDELRAAEKRGLRFGAHTMTHPILSRCTEAEVEHEVRASVEHVRAELLNPSSVFCYPNGRAVDFGSRETALVQSTGLSGAFSAVQDLLASTRPDVAPADWLYRLPRIAYDGRRGGVGRKLFPWPSGRRG